MRYTIVFILVVITFRTALSQHTYKAGVLFDLNISKSLKKDWKLTYDQEVSLPIFKGEFSKLNTRKFHYESTDFSFILSKKIFLNHSLGASMLVGFKDLRKSCTYGVQYAYIHTIKILRFSHRLAYDHTLKKENSPVYRLRYRLAFDLPLQGSQIDAKEFYIKLSNEYLGVFKHSRHDLEIRLSPTLGYRLNNHAKFEATLGYRVKEFVKNQSVSTHTLWIKLGTYINI